MIQPLHPISGFVLDEKFPITLIKKLAKILLIIRIEFHPEPKDPYCIVVTYKIFKPG